MGRASDFLRAFGLAASTTLEAALTAVGSKSFTIRAGWSPTSTTVSTTSSLRRTPLRTQPPVTSAIAG